MVSHGAQLPRIYYLAMPISKLTRVKCHVSLAFLIEQKASNEWVISLKFKASNDTNTWMEIDNGTTFAGNTDPEAIQIISFSKIVVARFISLDASIIL